MNLTQFDRWMTETLVENDTKQYIAQDILHNGLQFRGRKQVKRVGFGVSASLELFKQAKKKKCDALVTHHGIFLPKKQLDPVTHDRVQFLMQHDISLWSAHYVLDAHSRLGNNVQIIEQLGATPTERFVDFSGAPWGWVGQFDAPQTVATILQRGRFSPDTISYPFGPKQVKTMVVISGGAAPSTDDLVSLQEKQVDLYLTGEIAERTREVARDAKLNVIAGGHYHTEVYGLKALMQEMRRETALEPVWLSLPNNV